MLKALEKEKTYTIGACQSLGVTIYCALVATFFNFMSKTQPQAAFFGFFTILLIFVFSAAITGSLVFAYPAYLALVKNKIKEAISILGFTLLFSFVIIITTVVLIISFF